MNNKNVLFIGHGSPMNAIEINEFSESWKFLSQKIKKPKIILAISAHWYTDGMVSQENYMKLNTNQKMMLILQKE